MLQENINLAPLTTFGVQANSHYFAIFSSTEELCALLKEVKGRELLILGGGSNILFIKDFEGVTLKNEIKGMEVIKEAADAIFLKVGAGENWHHLVQHTVEKGWGGIENLSLIPGSVGASPMQNIGAYGVEIKDVFESLEAVEIETGITRTFTTEECEFGYRESVFKRALKGRYVITSVTYRLTKEPRLNTSYGAIENELKNRGITSPTLKDISEVVIAIRQSKLPDPKDIGSGGSFFKNPIISKARYLAIKEEYDNIPSYRIDKETVKVPAGWLIDTAGWKGKRFGNYGVYDKQALVLVNYSNAKGHDIYQLSKDIITDVFNKYGIELEREVNIIG